MRTSAHNRAVAISRWSKVQAKERAKINTSDDASILKALLCGMLAGDGSILKRKHKNWFHHEIKCYPDDLQMLSDFRVILRFIYDKNAHITDFGKMKEARLTSRTIYEDLTQQAVFGIYLWRVPFALLPTKDHYAAWLRGFFSAEAYVAPKGIKVQTVNKMGMNEVSKLLTELNINHSRYEYQSKNPRNLLVHIIWIGKRADKQRYQKLVGFSHARKEERLKQTLTL